MKRCGISLFVSYHWSRQRICLYQTSPYLELVEPWGCRGCCDSSPSAAAGASCRRDSMPRKTGCLGREHFLVQYNKNINDKTNKNVTYYTKTIFFKTVLIKVRAPQHLQLPTNIEQPLSFSAGLQEDSVAGKYKPWYNIFWNCWHCIGQSMNNAQAAIKQVIELPISFFCCIISIMIA